MTDNTIMSTAYSLESGWQRNRRIVQLLDRRTSISLEDAFWHSLCNIAKREGIKPSELVSVIDEHRNPQTPLTVATRLYILQYVETRLSHLAKIKQSLAH